MSRDTAAAQSSMSLLFERSSPVAISLVYEKRWLVFAIARLIDLAIDMRNLCDLHCAAFGLEREQLGGDTSRLLEQSRGNRT